MGVYDRASMHPEHHADLAALARDVATREGFAVDFPRDGRTTARTAPAAPDDAVRDVRHLPWSSIDNRESRDLDQIEVAERLSDGAIRVLVGVADVDALVPAGSSLDRHAGWNTTSLYAGVVTFPMLPDELSTDATSLLEGEERLALVTEFVVGRAGELSLPKVYRARVVNHAKLAYDEVGPWLEGRAAPPAAVAARSELDDQLRMQDEAAARLRSRRVEHGALRLETIEARTVADKGEVVALKLLEKNRARELIEDLMIATNGATARWLEDLRYASIRRVVRSPQRWDRIVDVARARGRVLPEVPDARALSEFLRLEREAAPARFTDLSLTIVKLLGPGEYAVADPDCPDGHFGLAVDDYAHSTAPNRRYGDLVTQRILKAASRGDKAPYSIEELGSIAARCTDQENHARKFERTMRKVAAALFLSTRLGDEFDAVVTGVTDRGTFVRLLDPPAEGRVVSGESGLDVGDTTRVRLVATEPSRGFIDFVRVRS